MSTGLEALKHLYAKLSCKSSIEDINENLKEYDIIEKELKALEIIKNHKCDMAKLLVCFERNWDYETYNKQVTGYQRISKENYEFLKEVCL